MDGVDGIQDAKELGIPETDRNAQRRQTLVGVVKRGHGQYVFVGTELERYQDNLTPEEIRLLKQELYKGYE